MKKSFLLMSSACILGGMMFFTSCGKDEDNSSSSCGESGLADNKLVVQVVNGNAYNEEIDEVKLVDGYLYGEDNIFSSTLYRGGGFTLELPKIADKYLYPILYVGENSEGVVVTDNLIISNRNVKGLECFVTAHKNGVNPSIGGFFYASSDNYYETGFVGGTGGYLLYVDRDVTITGTISFKYNNDNVTLINNYNCSLKKGWNIVYHKMTETANIMTMEITTQKPNIELKWYYESDYDSNYDAPSKKAKRSSLF